MSTKVHVHSDTLGQHVRRLLVVTQLVFFASLIVCWIVAGGDRASANGISFFGVYWPTLPIIALGYRSSSVGLWRTATYFQYLDQSKAVVFGLRYIAVGLVAFAALPDWKFGYLLQGETIFQIGFGLCLIELTFQVKRFPYFPKLLKR